MKVETPAKPALYGAASSFEQPSRQMATSSVGKKRISFETDNEKESNHEHRLCETERLERMQHLHRVLVDRANEIQRQTVAPFAEQCQKRFDRVGGWSDGIDFSNLAAPSVASRICLPDSKSQFPVTVVDRVLTTEMCQAFIDVTEQMGFSRPLSLLGLLAQKVAGDTQDEDCEQEADADSLGDNLQQFRKYAHEAQKNTSEQVQIESQQLADYLWQRLEAHLPVETTGEGSFTTGRYEKRGLIPVFRFMRYQKGQGFKVHKDPERAFYEYPLKTTSCTGTTKYGDEGIFKSLFTFALYLNDDFRGGHLNFVKLQVNPEKRYESQATLVPVTGRCAIFRHDELHEGGGVEEGIKYMIQCDVLYERVGDLSEESNEQSQCKGDSMLRS